MELRQRGAPSLRPTRRLGSRAAAPRDVDAHPRPPQVYLTWSGPSVGAVKRAKAMSARAAMRAKLGTTSVDLEVAAREDLTLDQVR